MEALLHFVLLAVFAVLTLRWGFSAGAGARDHTLKAGHGQPGSAETPKLRRRPPDRDTDPVCKQIVTTDTARTSVYAGSVHYFCSRDCREIFEAAPELYVGTRKPQYLEHSHV